MAESFGDVIAQLERQRSAIERALSALRDINEGSDGKPHPDSTSRKRGRPAKSTGGITAEGRQRLAEAMRRRWAIKRTAAQAKRSARKK